MRVNNPHTHTYERQNLARAPNPPYWIYKCNSCPHYISLAASLGRPAACGVCGEPYTINVYHVKNKIMRPKCPRCGLSKKAGGQVPSIPELLKFDE